MTDDDDVTALMRSLNTPLIVLTAAANDQTAGCVVGFHTQCSIDPVRYAIWVSKANHTFRVAMFATHFAVHFLDVADHEVAEWFGGRSGDDVDKFAGVGWTPGPGGVPLLDSCPNRLVLRRMTVWDDGCDHVCLVGEPIDVGVGDKEVTPMRLTDADDIDAGHAAEERTTPDELRSDEPADAAT